MKFGLRFSIGFAFLLFCASVAWCQTPARKIDFKIRSVEGNHNQYGQGIMGILIKYDVEFSWYESEFTNQNFDVTFRLEQNGKVLPSSAGAERSVFFKFLRPIKNNTAMQILGDDFFIPYSEIPLESGVQDIDIVFSAKNKTGNYPDCDKEGIRYTHVKTIVHDLNEQVFQFEDFKMDYHSKLFSIKTPAMDLTANVKLKYGPNEIKEDKYSLTWTLRSANGNVIYNSKNTKSTGDQRTTLSPKLVKGTASASLKASLDYYKLEAEGPTKATLEFFLEGAEGGPKSVFKQEMQFDFPTKYKFEEQVFTLNKVVAQSTTKDGVQGIRIDYVADAKFNTVLRNPEKGDFYFYPQIYNTAGKQIILPTRAPKAGSLTTQLQDGFLPEFDKKSHEGHVFVPAYMLDLPTGSHNLSFSVLVSDKNLETEFPILSQGKFDATKPEEVIWFVALVDLQMVEANYDPKIFAMKTYLPELQYSIGIGNDRFFESEYVKNSLTGVPGSITMQFSQGDVIRLRLYDVDSGFFNDSDFLGGWELPYPGNGQNFESEITNEGQVLKLRVTGKKR